MADDSDEKKMDWFEFFVALLLGLGAVGGAWASFQGDLWGGQQSEGYGEAATMMSEAGAKTTEAATVTTLAVTLVARDASLDIQAKQLILEGLLSKDADPIRDIKTFGVAKWLYSHQLSEDAYKHLGLPADWLKEDEGKKPAEGGESEELVTQAEKEALVASLDKEIDATFFGTQLAEGQKMYADAQQKAEEAKARFKQGSEANETGDRFGMTGVLYTVALFLAGIALVFKSKVRWGFGVLGLVAFVAATIHLLTGKFS